MSSKQKRGALVYRFDLRLKRRLKDHNDGKIPATKEMYELSKGGITAETAGYS